MLKYHQIYCGLALPGTNFGFKPEKLEKSRQKERCRFQIKGVNYFSNPSEQVQTKT
jgi:hypothetical protein